MHIESIPMCRLLGHQGDCIPMLTFPLQGRARATTTPIVSATCYSNHKTDFAEHGFLHEVVSDEKTKDAVIIDPANPPEYVQTCYAGTTAFNSQLGYCHL